MKFWEFVFFLSLFDLVDLRCYSSTVSPHDQRLILFFFLCTSHKPNFAIPERDLRIWRIQDSGRSGNLSATVYLSYSLALSFSRSLRLSLSFSHKHSLLNRFKHLIALPSSHTLFFYFDYVGLSSLELSISLFVLLSVCLPFCVYLSVCLIFYQPVSVYLSRSVCLSLFVSLCLSVSRLS